MTRFRMGAPVTSPQDAPGRGSKPAPSTPGEPVLKPNRTTGFPAVEGKPRRLRRARMSRCGRIPWWRLSLLRYGSQYVSQIAHVTENLAPPQQSPSVDAPLRNFSLLHGSLRSRFHRSLSRPSKIEDFRDHETASPSRTTSRRSAPLSPFRRDISLRSISRYSRTISTSWPWGVLVKA